MVEKLLKLEILLVLGTDMPLMGPPKGKILINDTKINRNLI